MRTLSLRASAGSLMLAVALVACTDAPLGPSLGAESLQSTTASTGGVVISQVYGGGGNSGATYKNDFIELYNAGSTSVTLDGWSVQYASATGTSWARTNLSGVIAPGGYYLVQQAAGTGGTVNLPTPDASGSIAMSATAGKVALVNGTTALAVSCPTGVVDLVGFGSTANCFEGTAPTPAPSNTNAVLRKNEGCTDTNDNAADFAALAPSPRNSASPTRSCAAMPAVASVTVTPFSTTVAVGSTQAFKAKALDAEGQEITGVTFTWVSSNTSVATVGSSGVATGVAAGSATMTATAPNEVSGAATLEVTPPETGETPSVFVSELHYDNKGADVEEGVEVTGPAGTSLAGWSIVLYNGSGGAPYNPTGASGPTSLTGTIPAQCDGNGTLVFLIPGIQNGDPDGVALVAPGGRVVEFLSYGGTFTAIGGPANGMVSTDIGVKQTTSTALGRSLQRAPSGPWFGPAKSSFGECNGEAPPLPSGIIFEGYSFRGSTPLPVGFGELYRVKDRETNQFIRSGVTFTTSDPSVATIDALGNVTAAGVGTTTLEVTETATGRTASFPLTTTMFAWSDTSVYADELQFGTPRDATPDDDILVNRATFAASWNSSLGQPNWVAYNLEGTHRISGADRCDCFIQDPALPGSLATVTTADYDGSGYSRGHMTMSADRTRGAFDNATTFYFTNIIPQTSQNNAGPWLALEQHLGNLAVSHNKEIFIFAGGAAYSGTLNNAGRVAIPTRTWKIAVILDRDKGITDVTSPSDLEVIAVDMPNSTSMPSSSWEYYRVSVASIEALTGYDFLAALPEAIECRVEVRNCLPEASIESGSYIVTEGSSLTINASGTDPDGDALVFKWTVNNNVVTAEGNVLTYIFADNGRYEVQLTVTDPHGASSIASSYVTVTNVAPEVNAFTGATGLQGETYGGEGRFVDPGADTWTATVDYGDGSGVQLLTLSGKEFTLSHTYTKAGEFTVTVTVTDKDGENGTQAAKVFVQTPKEGIVSLSGMVDALVSGGVQTASISVRSGGTLSQGNANALKATLQAAGSQLEKENRSAAVKQMQAFINQVNSLVAEGKLPSSDGATLTNEARRIIRSIDSLMK